MRKYKEHARVKAIKAYNERRASLNHVFLEYLTKKEPRLKVRPCLAEYGTIILLFHFLQIKEVTEL